MNQIERLQSDLTRQFPGLETELDRPLRDSSPWFLDIMRPDQPRVVIEWRPDRGFGLSTLEPDDFGAGPNEIHPNFKAAFERVAHLISTGEASVPPQKVGLAELRLSRGFSQSELASKAGMTQPSVAGIEERDDIKVSTLIKVVSAMGASLHIMARFPDGMERELKL